MLLKVLPHLPLVHTTTLEFLNGCIKPQCIGRNCIKNIPGAPACGNDNQKAVMRNEQVHASSNGLSFSLSHTYTHTHTHRQTSKLHINNLHFTLYSFMGHVYRLTSFIPFINCLGYLFVTVLRLQPVPS